LRFVERHAQRLCPPGIAQKRPGVAERQVNPSLRLAALVERDPSERQQRSRLRGRVVVDREDHHAARVTRIIDVGGRLRDRERDA